MILKACNSSIKDATYIRVNVVYEIFPVNLFVDDCMAAAIELEVGEVKDMLFAEPPQLSGS